MKNKTKTELLDIIEDLKQDLENMTREKDEQYDRAERLQEELNEYDDKPAFTPEQEQLLSLVMDYQDQRHRAELGVINEAEECRKTLDLIYDLKGYV